MSDIDIFDPVSFFDQRIRDLEQELIAKQTRAEILQANRLKLEKTLQMLGSLPEADRRALQMEVTSLADAREQTVRAIEALTFELENLMAKLKALRSARRILQAEGVSDPPEANTPGGVREPRPAGGAGKSGTES